MKRSSSDTPRSLFGVGMLVGAGIGALVALFAAPMRGAQLREAIIEYGLQLKDRLDDAVSPKRR